MAEITTPGMQWQWISPGAQGYRELIEALDLYQNTIYPPESNHLDSLEELGKSHVKILGAYYEQVLVGTCALKNMEDYGELKRLYVQPEFRGRGISRHLILKLEQELLAQGVNCAKAETGIYQAEALGLYRKLGYQDCGPFGQYRQNPFNLFFSKDLSGDQAS